MSSTLQRMGFPTTNWDLLARAGSSVQDASGQSLSEVLRLYLPALRRYIERGRRMPRNEAEDLLQAFLADKVVSRRLLERADPKRGRFRNYLLRSLEHYMIDVGRAKDAHGWHATLRVGFDGPSGGFGSTQVLAAFEYDWAKCVITDAIARTHRHLHTRGRRSAWLIFEQRIVTPMTDGVPPRPYKQLMEELGFATPLQAANALINAKRLFIQMLRQILVEQAIGPTVDPDEELRDLRKIIARGA